MLEHGKQEQFLHDLNAAHVIKVNMSQINTPINAPVKIQRWGGAFQVEVVSDPSVKQALFGWMSAQELGPQSTWRFSNMLDSKKIGVIRHAQLAVVKRPGPTRSGYLCFYPPLKVAIFVEDVEQRKQEESRSPRIAILRMRHSPSIYNSGGSVFAATLVVSDSTLWIEDVLVWQGQNIWKTHTFSKRWSVLKDWFEQDWSEDEVLQRGLIIKPRCPEPLTKFNPQPGDVWEFIPEDAQKRRLLWKDRRNPPVVLYNYPQKPLPPKQPRHHHTIVKQEKPEEAQKNTIQVGILDTYFPTLPQPNDGSLIAVAKKDMGGPDVYSLFAAEMVPLGIAVIRKLTISHAMRKYCVDKTFVKVEWNSSFDRWEIVDVNISNSPSPAAAFKHE